MQNKQQFGQQFCFTGKITIKIKFFVHNFVPVSEHVP